MVGEVTIRITVADGMNLSDVVEDIANAVEEIKTNGQSGLYTLTADSDRGIYVDHGNGYVSVPEEIGSIRFRVA